MSDLLNQYERMAREDDMRMRIAPGASTFATFELDAARKVQKLADAFCQTNWDCEMEFDLERALEQMVQPKMWDSTRAAFLKGLPLCESPIEKRLFPWLLCQPYSCFEHLPCVLLAGEGEALKPYTVAIVPQLKIGRRRADFALAARRGGPTRFVIVECDGEEFHKDVDKDVARDAELMRVNRVLDVHPITGKEIYRDAKAAALTASRALTDAWSKLNKNTQAKFAQGRP